MDLKILNETVYDSDDVRTLLFWVREKGYPLETQRRKESHDSYQIELRRKNPTHVVKPFNPWPIRDTPWEEIRLGYYGGGKHRDDSPKWTSWSSPYNKTPRLGIVKHTKLPLVPMEVIAHAAADKDQRTLPPEVHKDLIKLFCELWGYRSVADEFAETHADEAPKVRYAFKADKASAKASKRRADRDNLKRARKNVGYLEREVEHLEEKLRIKRTKLLKARSRIAKLEAKVAKHKQTKRMEAVCD